MTNHWKRKEICEKSKIKNAQFKGEQMKENIRENNDMEIQNIKKQL
jgi:hypothetical protein